MRIVEAMKIVVCYTAVLCVITQRSLLETKIASLFALLHVIGHFRVPKTLTFKVRLGAQSFLRKWVSFTWEWKMISIRKAGHLPSFWNRGTRKWPIHKRLTGLRGFVTRAQLSARGVKCPPFLCFFFGITLVHVNLCMHTCTRATVTLRGAGGRGLFKKIYTCWQIVVSENFMKRFEKKC